MGRLYCGDSNSHVRVESFSSHISLTLRTPVLFIFGRVTRIGHGMKYILRCPDKCPGKRRRRLQNSYLSMQERGGEKSRQREWRTIRCGHCADCQYSQSPNFNRSQIHRLRGDELYRPISSQKLIPYQPAPERVWGAEAKARGDGRKERLAWGQLWKKLISSTDYPQAGVTHDERSHTKRIKSFCQQLRQVEMKDGMTDGGEEER